MDEFGITMNAEGWAVVAWRDDDGNYVDAELDPECDDVKDALRIIRKIIWGEPND